MASWEDGPEYAPAQRPEAFQAPRVTALQDVPKQPSIADGAPFERPSDFAQPSTPAPALASLAPCNDVARDATEPFDVGSMILTQFSSDSAESSPRAQGPSAWGSAHSSTLDPPGSATGGFDPTQPIMTSSHRATGVADFAPPTSAPVAVSAPRYLVADDYSALYPPPGTPTGPVGFKEVWEALTPGVAIGLLIGGFIPPLAPMTYLVAFAFSSRVRFGTSSIRNAFTVGLIGVTFGAIVSVFGEPDFAEWWSRLGWWSLWISWATLVASAIFAYRARSAGSSGGGSGRSASASVNLNTASHAQLDALPGIGPVTASNIIEWRSSHGRFNRIEELQEVSGIGAQTFARIAPHVHVERPDQRQSGGNVRSPF